MVFRLSTDHRAELFYRCSNLVLITHNTRLKRNRFLCRGDVLYRLSIIGYNRLGNIVGKIELSCNYNNDIT